MKIGTARDVRRLDEAVIAEYGVGQAVLMENAAIAARDVVARRWGIADRDILVVCGTGNNGGDGFALARLLYARGAAVTILAAGEVDRMSGAAADNAAIAGRLPLEILRLESAPRPPILDRHDFERYDLIVDALFGTGLSRDVDGRYAQLIRRLNDARPPILALDIPSGIDADTGEVLGCAVRADATVSFGIPKRGNLLYPGFEHGGALYHSEISFPPEVTGDESLDTSVNIPPDPPPRSPSGHKGSFGKILIVGGSASYRGAPTLAAAAALKSGAGYARLAVPAELVPQIFPLVPEAVFLPQEGGGSLGAEHLPDLLDQAEAADALVLGPGLSTAPESIRLARDLTAAAKAPLLIDGDGLSAVAGREELLRDRNEPVVLTPHPGEMARLLGSSIREVEARRIDTAREAAERYGAVVVLKGAHTVIAEPGGGSWINLTGNSGMGTAGSGDILAGVAGTLLAAHRSFEGGSADAARLAVHLHGLAGDLAAEELGERSMTGGDILRFLPGSFREFRRRLGEDPFSGKIRPV